MTADSLMSTVSRCLPEQRKEALCTQCVFISDSTHNSHSNEIIFKKVLFLRLFAVFSRNNFCVRGFYLDLTIKLRPNWPTNGKRVTKFEATFHVEIYWKWRRLQCKASPLIVWRRKWYHSLRFFSPIFRCCYCACRVDFECVFDDRIFLSSFCVNGMCAFSTILCYQIGGRMRKRN